MLMILLCTRSHWGQRVGWIVFKFNQLLGNKANE